jgi:ACS family hexuronate transporter-like MFS transporter
MQWGWRSAFLVTGLFGFVWVVAFQIFRRLHPQMQAGDRGHRPGEDGNASVRWRSLVRYRQTWAVFFMRFFADSVWSFYAFWIPEFLTRERGLDLASIAAVAWIPFLVADIGNVAGGYVTLRLERAGWSVNRTRKSLLVLATLLSPIGVAAVFAESVFWTIGFISIGIFFWMFWAVTVHTLPGDYFPPHAVASVFGLGGTGSTLGSVVSTWAVGYTLDLTQSYVPVFVGIGLLMPVAFVVGFSLMGRVEPIRFAAGEEANR